MSILTCWVTPARALVGVDTLALRADGSAGEFGKMYVLPQAAAVFAGRGGADFLTVVYVTLQAQGGKFDDIAERLPALLNTLMRALSAQFAALKDDAGAARLQLQQLVFVGWSDRLARMICHAFTQETVAGGIAHEVIDSTSSSPYFIAPWDKSFARLCFPQKVSEGMQPIELGILARAQVAWLAKVTPDDVSGGRLILAEMSRGSVRTWEECDLQDGWHLVKGGLVA